MVVSEYEENPFRQLADVFPAMMWRVGLDNQCLWVNRAWLEFTGRTAEEEVGEGWLTTLHPDDFDRYYPALFDSFCSRKPMAFEFRVRNRDGQYRWLSVHTAPQYADGDFVGCIYTGVDIHEPRETVNSLLETNQRFQLLSRATRDVIWDWNLRTDHVEWNEALVSEFGYPPDARQSTGKWWSSCIHPDDRTRVLDAIMATVDSTAEHWEDEYRFRKANGAYAVVYDRGFVVRDDRGHATKMLGAMQDLTERVRARRAVEEMQSRFARVAAATELGVWYCDLPFAELQWNREVKDHFWLPADARVTIDLFYERLHPDDRERTQRAVTAAIESAGLYDTTFRTVHPADAKRIKWIRAMGWADYDETGKAIRFDGITFDVTEMRQFSEQRDRALADTRESLRARDEFLSIASHELKTPLTSLHLQLQMMLRSLRKLVAGDPDPGGRYAQAATSDRLIVGLETCERQSARLSRLLEELLDLTRVRLGRLALARRQVGLLPLVHEMIERFRPEIEAQGYAVRLEVTGEPPMPSGHWDPSRVDQILTNLFSNALKYGEGRPIEIQIDWDTSRAVFRVRDRGMGIAPELQAKIFDRFERGVAADKISGLGLGLYITRQLVEAHGGTIRVVSRLAEGAEFSVELPFAGERLVANSPGTYA